MKKYLSLFVMLLSAITVQAAENDPIKTALESLLPGMKIDSIANAPVPGLLEVVLDGQLIYVSEDGKYLIQGSIYDTQAKKDLTEVSRNGIRKALLDGVDSSQSIQFSPEKPEHTITVFTDIDCGYCRKLHNEMAGYNAQGIAVEYLFFPRAGIGSDAFNKAVNVWCADDQNKAMDEAKGGKDIEAASCQNPIAQQFELGKKLGVTGTPAILTQKGTLIPGYMPPEKLKQRLDLDAKG